MSVQMQVYSLTDLAAENRRLLEARLAAFVDQLDQASVMTRIAKANTRRAAHHDSVCANLERTVNVVPFDFSHRRLHRPVKATRSHYVPVLKLCTPAPTLPAA